MGLRKEQKANFIAFLGVIFIIMMIAEPLCFNTAYCLGLVFVSGISGMLYMAWFGIKNLVLELID